MAQNARATGTPPAKPSQSQAMAQEAKSSSSTTSKPVMQPTPVQQAQALHHIGTNKNWISTARGGPWSPKFEPFFKYAGLDINKAPANLVEVLNHRGPHPEAYHRLVLDRLTNATTGLKPFTNDYSNAVTGTLQAIGKEVQTVGTEVNKLLTQTPK
jgi:hypothetical protein